MYDIDKFRTQFADFIGILWVHISKKLITVECIELLSQWALICWFKHLHYSLLLCGFCCWDVVVFVTVLIVSVIVIAISTSNELYAYEWISQCSSAPGNAYQFLDRHTPLTCPRPSQAVRRNWNVLTIQMRH